MLIAVDFDGTIVEEKDYPSFGMMLPYAKQVILGLYKQHHIMVLYTLRDVKFISKDRIAPYLENAIEFLKNEGIKHCFYLPRDQNFCEYNWKFPYDFLIDDKAMVDGKVDWLSIAKRFNIEIDMTKG